MHVLNPYRYKSGFDINALVLKVNTALVDVSNVFFTIPTAAALTYNYDVETSDGQTFSAQTGNLTITFPSVGEYFISIIGTFPKINFANSSPQRNALTEIIQWGNITYDNNQSNAFYGCTNLISAGAGGEVLDNVTAASSMFRLSEIGNLDESFGFINLINGLRMFEATDLSTTPNRMGLRNLTEGRFMFLSVPITSIGTDFRLDSISFGASFMNLLNINTDRYSEFINDLDTLNPNDGVTLNMGSSTYNSSAQTAHDNLTTTRGWTIADGGLV